MSRPANAAGFLIHSAVHKLRPDVIAACHTHSIHDMAWASFARPLEMLNQDIAYLYGDAQAVYKAYVQTHIRKDNADFLKDFGGVVLMEEGGERLAAALGEYIV